LVAQKILEEDPQEAAEDLQEKDTPTGLLQIFV